MDIVNWLTTLHPAERAVYLSALWGFVYNIANIYADKTGFNDLYRPVTIAFGVFVELLILGPAIGYENSLIAFGGFAAAGASMVAGGFVSILQRLSAPKAIKRRNVGQQLKANRNELDRGKEEGA
jgi:hypothetical protein